MSASRLSAAFLWFLDPAYSPPGIQRIEEHPGVQKLDLRWLVRLGVYLGNVAELPRGTTVTSGYRIAEYARMALRTTRAWGRPAGSGKCAVNSISAAILNPSSSKPVEVPPHSCPEVARAGSSSPRTGTGPI